MDARYLRYLGAAAAGAGLALAPLAQVPQTRDGPTRTGSIPRDAVKATPQTDAHPPVLHDDRYGTPVPLPAPINTAGAEDSPFITPDGRTLYWFFTPDVRVPPEQQVLDGITGIYVSGRQRGRWGPASRVVLQDPGKPALDGCACRVGDTMWFGSARQGNHRGVDIWTAHLRGGRWTDWRNAGRRLNVDYAVGELHVTADGREMYFHSERPGGAGGLDIWVTRLADDEWQEPENVRAVNTAGSEGWPFVSRDGRELWFTRTYQGSPAIFRSRKEGGEWGEPALVVAQFAGEPSLDDAGNLYFCHHFFRDGLMVEADIYVARPRRGGSNTKGTKGHQGRG